MEQANIDGAPKKWYVLQTLSNMEQKVKRRIESFIKEDPELTEYIGEVLLPMEKVFDVQKGKKITRDRKFYPGYLFVNMCLYKKDEHDNEKFLVKPWTFIRNIDGVIDIVGSENPVALKKKEIDDILAQVKLAEGGVVPKIIYNVGEEVKINEGPFQNLTGTIDAIDNDRGKLQVSVSIFGRLTPVELEFNQVERVSQG